MFSNPWISIQTASKNGVVKQGKTTNISLVCGNAGNGQLVKNSVIVTLSVPDTARITSVSKVKKSDYKGWKVKSLTKGAGNTLQLINDRKLNEFDLSQILINVKGEKVSTWKTITANIAFVLGQNPELGGAPNTSQGNQSATDDNSTTSLTVIK